MILTADQRVMLARRIAEDRLIALEPPFTPPDWACELQAYSYTPIAFVMTANGVVGPWRYANEIDWLDAVAVRFETPWGCPIDPRANSDWDDY